VRAVVVGAGIAGLLAARELQRAGHEVVVFDKGRGPGGRLATRRIAGARLDHGAQFFTVRDDEFARQVHDWTTAGLVYEWCRGFDTPADGHPRYAVRGGMNALAKHLARGLDVRCGSLVFAVRRGTERAWDVALDDGAHVPADAVVLTCPIPQSFSLLVTAEVDVPEALWRTDYDRTLCLLAVLDRAPALAPPGGVQHAEGCTFVADNQAKGISGLPALTVHADPAWSEAHWDAPAPSAHAALLDRAAEWIAGATVVESQLKRWRFATPRSVWPDRCWLAPGAIAMAGDAFAGPRVEGAALSGLAAAAALLDG
jgi:predicted NAD/FAD-dependent oxidoreductase